MHPTPRAECRPRPGALLAALLGVVCLGPAALAGPPRPPDEVCAVASPSPAGPVDEARGPKASGVSTEASALLDACRAACRALETLHVRVEYQRLDAGATEPYAPRLARVRLQRQLDAAPRLSVIADVEPLTPEEFGWAYHLVADGVAAAALDSRGPRLRQAPIDAASALFEPVDGLLPTLLLAGRLHAGHEPGAPAPKSVRRLGLSVVHGVRCDVLEVLGAEGVLTRLHVGSSDQLPRRIESLGPDGVEHITVLWDLRPGVPLSDRDFALPLPAGVVIEPPGSPTASGN